MKSELARCLTLLCSRLSVRLYLIAWKTKNKQTKERDGKKKRGKRTFVTFLISLCFQELTLVPSIQAVRFSAAFFFTSPLPFSSPPPRSRVPLARLSASLHELCKNPSDCVLCSAAINYQDLETPGHTRLFPSHKVLLRSALAP